MSTRRHQQFRIVATLAIFIALALFLVLPGRSVSRESSTIASAPIGEDPFRFEAGDPIPQPSFTLGNDSAAGRDTSLGEIGNGNGVTPQTDLQEEQSNQATLRQSGATLPDNPAIGSFPIPVDGNSEVAGGGSAAGGAGGGAGGGGGGGSARTDAESVTASEDPGGRSEVRGDRGVASPPPPQANESAVGAAHANEQSTAGGAPANEFSNEKLNHIFGEDLSETEPFTDPAGEAPQQASVSGTTGSTPPHIANPEPASLLLLGTGLAFAARHLKRRVKATLS